MFDLGHGTTLMSDLVCAVRDDQLGQPTPCTEWTVADLLTHIHQFSNVFTANATKTAPDPPGALVDDWRTAIPEALADLAAAWQRESAWQGRVSAGGVEMDAADNAVVAAEELTVHGWDLARATGQAMAPVDSQLDRVDAFFEVFGGAPFGPPGDAAPDATRLARVIARTGRDPHWSPAR
ncbi:TIGR03086 family metal-binding protein [Flexivirga sp.]|uniref:TIGR03086 family metal-binding protein n=1 Tax=Flexivirga sp. TaxID=1962927 RepID=UPI003F7F6C02